MISAYLRFFRLRPGGCSKEVLLVDSYMFATFFVAVRVGFEEHIRLPTSAILAIVFLWYFFRFRNIHVNRRVGLTILLSLAYVFIDYLIAATFQVAQGHFRFDAIAWFLKYFVLFSAVLLISSVSSPQEVTNSFLRFACLSIPFVYLSYALALAGIVFGADVWAGGIIRPHGFYSEPSNLCWSMPVLTLIAVKNRLWRLAVVALLTSLISLSPTVMAVLAVMSLVLVLSRISIQFRIVLLSSLVSLMVLIGANAHQIYNYLGDSEGAFLVLQRLLGGMLYVSNQSDGYSNSRWDLYQSSIEFFRLFSFAPYVGFGMGVSNAYADDYNLGMTLDSSLPAFVLNSLGIPGGVVLAFLYFKVLTKKRASFEYKFVLASITLAGLINPSGIFWQMLCMLFLFTGLFSSSSKETFSAILATSKTNGGRR